MLRFRWYIILTGTGAALSFLAQIVLGGKLDVWWRVGITGGGMICTGLAVALPLLQQRQYEKTLDDAREASKKARLEASTALQDSLIPAMAILRSIARAQTDELRDQLKSDLKRAIVSRAARDIGPDRTRSCYYEFDAGPPKSLACRDIWEGRGTRPSEPYTDRTLLGRTALTMVMRRQSSFRPDLDADPPPGWPADREYKTYIAVTVVAESQIFGMLTIDSLRAGDLTADEVPQMQLLADFLAVGLVR